MSRGRNIHETSSSAAQETALIITNNNTNSPLTGDRIIGPINIDFDCTRERFMPTDLTPMARRLGNKIEAVIFQEEIHRIRSDFHRMVPLIRPDAS
ncbi:unnamed protein product, partial [Prunus brigantina]